LTAEQKTNADLTSKLAVCNQRGDVLTNDIADYDQKLQQCEDKASGLIKDLDETSANASNQVSELNSQIVSLGGDLTTAKEALAKAQDDHEGCNGRLEDCEAHKTELAEDVERLTGEIAAVTETKESLDNQIDALT